MALPFSLNPSLATLPVYVPGRPIEEVARELGIPAAGIIKLASNENPLGPSPAALKAMEQVLQNLHLYPDGSAFYFKKQLAEKLGIAPGHLILGNGSNEIIEFVGHGLIHAGMEVIVSQYCFAIYPIITKLFGGSLRMVPAKNHGHDLPAMLAAITEKTRVIFVANPNNPTGTLVPRENLLEFINAVPKEILIVLDEAYIEFLDGPADFVPLVASGNKPNLLLMRTFSKIFGLAGLRLGYGIGHPELISAMEKVRQPFNINSIAQAGALAALQDDEHVRRTRENNRLGIQFFEHAFKRLELEFVPSAANFIMAKVVDGQRVFLELQKRGVITRPMGGYDLPQWIRISVGTPPENQKCLAALEAVIR